jgi:type IV pilus assembly protein PilY1
MPNENLTRIDDLWHAAVNGRGTFFNANNVSTLSNGLKKAFAEAASGGSGGAAATGNLAPAAGDNEIYLATFRLVPETSEASGDVNQYPIDPDTGIVSTTAAWSARTKLDARVSNFTDSRNILMASGPTSLVQFDKANLTTAIANKWFSPGTDNPSGPLEQYSFYSAAQITNAAKPENMIAYLRGQRGWEDPANNVLDADPAFGAKLFRGRAHVLGDIVNSSPVYVKKPAFDYQDTGYAAFVSTPRSGVVYVGANDGMLHAFDSVTGEEKWAFIPTAVMPYLYKLADKNYVAKHRYYVNGALTIGDVDFSTDGTDWRTVLIGGLGLGGRAFFALDITNPDSPSLLWEFSAKTSGGVCVGTTGTTCDEDLGYSYGNAQMAKLDGGAWVAFFPSGYNNVAPPASPPPPTSPPALTGDGDSRLYVVNLKNGAKLKEIPTGSGSDPSLNGIAWVNGWTDDGMRNNSVKHVYGGDLSGRVWRFDITGSGSATLLTKLGYAAFGDQPVTTRPELGDFVGDIAQRVVYVGTGRYLGFSDIDNVDIQSLYAIRDSSASPKSNVGGAGLFRSSGAVKLFSAGDRTAGLTYNAVTSNSYGWYMDFTAGDPVTGKKGERITVNPLLYPDQLNLSVVTNLPSGDKCDVGGKSWAYFLNTQPTAAKSAVMADTVQYVGSALAAGSTNLTLESGKRVTVITKSDGSTVTLGGGTPAYGNKVRRVSWRELRN